MTIMTDFGDDEDLFMYFNAEHTYDIGDYCYR